jgi:hypothetical protein
MRVFQEEIFGPIMCIFKVKGDSDDEAIRMANNCKFALSSCAFSGSFARAKKVASQLTAGMSAVNDLEGCTYMSQSLPFGGCKDSGYDRFAGPEGLRGLCMIRSVCEDLVPFIRNAIPPPMQYPSTGVGHKFANGLIKMFYSRKNNDVAINSKYIITSPGIVYFIGNKYIILRCPEIEEHLYRSLSYSKYTLGLAKFRVESVGINSEKLSITKLPVREFHPIGKLSRLSLRFETNKGGLYDFKGINHNIIFAIFYYEPIQKSIPKKSILNPEYKMNYIDYLYIIFTILIVINIISILLIIAYPN